MSTPISPAHSVTIIGAGPAGLLLANLLQKHQIPVQVYEADPSPSSRNQGGTLDLHEETGLAALKEAGLFDVVMAKARMGDAENMKIMKGDGEVVYDENDKDGPPSGLTPNDQGGEDTRGRPEIDRTDLRNTLIESLAEGTIQWDHKITEITAIDNDTYEINFTSQPSTITSLLIGADGAWSKVRPLLHSVKPRYTGLTMYDLQIPAENVTSELQAFIGKGTCMILQDQKGLIPQMNSGGKCRAYAAVFDSNDGDDRRGGKLPESGKKEWVRDLYAGWDERCGQLVDAAEEESIVERKIWAFDRNLSWDSGLSGVTIIGDASHVMAPSGEGVNLALHDALVLGQQLIPLLEPSTADISLDRKKLLQTVREFEAGMMDRAKEEMDTAEMMLDVCYGPKGGAMPFKQMLETLMAGGPPQE